MNLLDVVFTAVHLFPAPGHFNAFAVPDAIRLAQQSQYQVVARDESRAVNDIRAKHGLPPLNQRGEPQEVIYVHQATPFRAE